MRLHGLALIPVVIGLLGCSRVGALPSPTPVASAVATPAATRAPWVGCAVRAEMDNNGPGTTFTGSGYPPDVPLYLKLANANGSQVLTETDFPELRSDARGASEIHLYGQRKDIGRATAELSGGGCTATAGFSLDPDRFPAAECDAADSAAPSGTDVVDAYASAVAADDPIGYWRFEESAGQSAGGADGTQANLSGGAKLGQPGVVAGSRAILLDGTDGQVDIPDFSFDGDFTIEAWLRFCGEFIGFQDGLVGQAGPGPDINFFEWHARVWDGESDILISPQKVDASGWEHLAVTRSGSDMSLFENGRKMDTAKYDRPYPVKVLGQANDGYFGGWLDEVAFYDDALSMETLQARAALNR